MERSTPVVVSLGGSLVVPDEVAARFVERFCALVRRDVASGRRFVVIVGGGALARRFQKALREARADASAEDLDWIGIYATHLNAHLLRLALGSVASPEVLTSDDGIPDAASAVVLGAGLFPGRSTDYATVLAATKVGAKAIANLSNVTHVYDRDPKDNPDAKPFSKLSWGEYRALIPEHATPGLHAPFDPEASRLAAEHGISVAIMGSDLSNFERYLSGDGFEGTTIS